MINPYKYARIDSQVTLTPMQPTALGTHSRVELLSGFSARLLGDTHIMGDFLFPHGKKQAPLAILVHGMGDRSAVPCRMVARDLARQGIASFLLYLVFHSLRAPRSIKNHYPNLSAEEWDESYKISVTDVHHVLDWAATRPEIIQSQISLLGISFGSFITTIAMALDKRVKKGILVECGGNSDKITKDSLLLRLRYKTSAEEFQQNQAAYSEYLKAVSNRGWDQVEAAKSSYLTDPLTFTGHLKGRPLMLLNAAFDEMIPKTATRELWESLGRPPIYWYPATHASLWLWYPLFSKKITDFIKNGSTAE